MQINDVVDGNKYQFNNQYQSDDRGIVTVFQVGPKSDSERLVASMMFGNDEQDNVVLFTYDADGEKGICLAKELSPLD